MKVFFAIFLAVAACIAIAVAQSESSEHIVFNRLFNFNCPGTGRYPAEGHCKAFYLCTANGGLGIRTPCPPLIAPYFDPNTLECVRDTGCIEDREEAYHGSANPLG